MPQKKIIEPKPSIGNKNKPFGMKKKPLENTQPIHNISQDEIEDEVMNEKQEEVKAKPPAKPFGNMGAKNKPTFGKFGKPFGNISNSGNSVNNSVIENKSNVSQNLPEPEAPKEKPVSFTEKYGLSNKDDSKVSAPIPTQPLNKNKANNAPWLKNKPTIGGNANNNSTGDYIPSIGGNTNNNNNTTGEYIPTMGGRANMPRRVGRPQQNTNVIPTLGEERKTEKEIDNIPMMNDQASNSSQIGSMPRRVGRNSNEGSLAGAQPMKVGRINNDRNNMENIPMIGSTNNDLVDNIPTIGDKKPNEGRKERETDNSGGYIPSGLKNKQEKPLPGGRKRAIDPFSKIDNYDPIKNLSNRPKPTPFGGNNISRISDNSGTNNESLFQSNRKADVQKSENFMDKFKGGNQKKDPPKQQNDFWGGILEEDKKSPPPQKVEPVKPAPIPQNNNKVSGFQDVASLDEEFILD